MAAGILRLRHAIRAGIHWQTCAGRVAAHVGLCVPDSGVRVPSMNPRILFQSAALAAALAGGGAALAATPAETFMARLAPYCGQAFEGRIEVDRPASSTPDTFSGKRLLMYLRHCDAEGMQIPFHVGDDHSRTWLLSRTANGRLRLKHDHRHEDGTPDEVTMYGGDSIEAGTAQRQTFPADAESLALFERENMQVSRSNVWALEIEPGQAFVYELARPGSERLFRVRFDLSRPLPAPASVWQVLQLTGSRQVPDPLLLRVRELEEAGQVKDVIVQESFPVQIRLQAPPHRVEELRRLSRPEADGAAPPAP